MSKYSMVLLLCWLIATTITGCNVAMFPFPTTPQVRDAGSRAHFQTGDPTVIVTKLVDQQNKIVAVIVRVPVAELTEEILQEISNPSAGRPERVYVLTEGQGEIRVIADGQEVRFNSDSLSGGPWIYYFNETEPFRRIQIANADVNQFQADVMGLHPLKFIEKWCAQKMEEAIPYFPKPMKQ